MGLDKTWRDGQSRICRPLRNHSATWPCGAPTLEIAIPPRFASAGYIEERVRPGNRWREGSDHTAKLRSFPRKRESEPRARVPAFAEMSALALAGSTRCLAFCRRLQLRDAAHTRVESSK